jgi:transcription antitermination factor NusG
MEYNLLQAHKAIQQNLLEKASRQQINAELTGQVLIHPENVAEIIRGTRKRISSVEKADELGNVDG